MESVWGECGKVCWGVGEVRVEVCGVWGEAGEMGGVKKCGRRCGRLHGGECGKVRWGVGIGEERNMGGVGKGRWGV